LRSYGTQQMMELLTEAVNIAAHGSMWHEKHMVWTQAHGLQGHKRLNRYESAKDRTQYIRIVNYCLDMFGEVIEPDWNYSVSAPMDIKGYLDAYLEWENSVYTRLAAIVEELEELGFPCEAALVSDGIGTKEIERVRRMMQAYTLAGWDMTYILITDKQLHDKMKRKEKKRR
jgi:ferritin